MENEAGNRCEDNDESNGGFNIHNNSYSNTFWLSTVSPDYALCFQINFVLVLCL